MTWLYAIPVVAAAWLLVLGEPVLQALALIVAASAGALWLTGRVTKL